MDAVEQARSGHPGMPLGMADAAEVLWTRFLRHDPADPAWPDRDRFVLSNGHGSMLLYALLHLTGYDLPVAELRRFRQLGSRTPGHPEHGHTPGVETTTGPLGQGLANAVGMALAERLLAAEFNRPGFPVVDHHTYAFVGDGCLMEGISHEAASLAGALGLGKLVVLFDDNGISIDGRIEGWCADDVPRRFEAYRWHVIGGVDGHDPVAIAEAIGAARDVRDRPSLVCLRTVIGKGAPTRAGSEAVHGAPLGAAEIKKAREAVGWVWPPFEIPARIAEAWDARAAGAERHARWRALREAYAAAHPDLAAELSRRLAGRLPETFPAVVREAVAAAAARTAPVATRKASQETLERLAPAVPELLGGSADLTHSNLTRWTGAASVAPGGGGGRYLHYGVREHGMTAVMNGLALHGGFIPFGGTFLVFSDYARGAIRMSALMRQRTVLVLTHDSIGVGEDGPTHQPIEQLASLRLVPGLDVWRPCDAAETAAAWGAALARREGPSALVLSRQDLPPQPRPEGRLGELGRGGYVLAEPADGAAPWVVLLATGSEVQLAVQAQATLAWEGIPARVVSMPCTSAFERQDAAYRDRVLPPRVPRVAVEAGVTGPWHRLVGGDGAVVGLDGFGLSGPAVEVQVALDLTAARVARAARAVARAA
jgi:transketolase